MDNSRPFAVQARKGHPWEATLSPKVCPGPTVMCLASSPSRSPVRRRRTWAPPSPRCPCGPLRAQWKAFGLGGGVLRREFAETDRLLAGGRHLIDGQSSCKLQSESYSLLEMVAEVPTRRARPRRPRLCNQPGSAAGCSAGSRCHATSRQQMPTSPEGARCDRAWDRGQVHTFGSTFTSLYSLSNVFPSARFGTCV